MTNTTNPRPADDAVQARELIENWLALDPEAQDPALARLIAATIHSGPGSELERFGATGELDPNTALAELNDVRVPFEREGWVDALGRFILTAGENA